MQRMPDTAALEAMPTLSVGWNANLKVDTGDFRLWLARTGLADGEPYEHTASIETLDDGQWLLLGDYDADDPPAGLPGVTPGAFRGEIR